MQRDTPLTVVKQKPVSHPYWLMILFHCSVPGLLSLRVPGAGQKGSYCQATKPISLLFRSNLSGEFWLILHGEFSEASVEVLSAWVSLEYLRENSTLQVRESSPQLRVNNFNILTSPENEDPSSRVASNNFVGDPLLTKGTVLLVRDFQGRGKEGEGFPWQFPQHLERC